MSNKSFARKRFKILYDEAYKMWIRPNVQRRNTKSYYQNIRSSPVVRFITNSNLRNFLRDQFWVTNNSSNNSSNNNNNMKIKVRSGMNIIVNRVPLYRTYYLMNTKPFDENLPRGFVKIANSNLRYGEFVGRRLGLVNKELMNRYITERSKTRIPNANRATQNRASTTIKRAWLHHYYRANKGKGFLKLRNKYPRVRK